MSSSSHAATPEPAKPATPDAQPDPVLRQPEKSHMHSKDAHPSGEASGATKKPA